MKKQMISVLLTLALVFSLSSPLLSRPLAASGIYFTAVNDTLCPLNDATMPFWSGGNLYVPSVVFSSYDLGLSYVRDTPGQTALLYNRWKVLEFDLAKGGANNKIDTYYSADAAVRQGTVYFPLAFVCSYFGLNYSIVEGKLAPMVRVKSDAVVLSDTQFADAAATLMSSRYTSYQQSKKKPQPKPKPEEKEPDVEPLPQEEPSDKTVARVYLSVRADGSGVPAMLDELDRYGYKATFFFTPQELEQQEDLLRRITATGHRVGLIATEENAENALARGNASLRRITGTTTHMVLNESGAALPGSYVAYRPTLKSEDQSGSAANRAKRIVRKIQGSRGTVQLMMGSSAEDAGAFRTVCAALHEKHHTVRAVNEVVCG